MKACFFQEGRPCQLALELKGLFLHEESYVISTHFCFETMPTLSHVQHHRHCYQLQVIFRAITIHPGPQTGKLGVTLDSPLSPFSRPNPSACSLGSKSVRLSLVWRSSFQSRFHHHHCLSSLLIGVSTSALSLSVYSVMRANHEKISVKWDQELVETPPMMSTKSVVNLHLPHFLMKYLLLLESLRQSFPHLRTRIPG